MKVNASMLFNRIRQYFAVEYSHISQDNFAKAPMFFNEFFDLNEHIVLVSAYNLKRCLNKARRAIIICLDPPAEIPANEIATNDLIILNDPMSDKMAFNILNHILDAYQDFEHRMNEVLYNHQSFQEMVEIITQVVDLPLSLTDENFHFIAFSRSSGKYIGEYVTPENELTRRAVETLQSNRDFRKLERIRDSFYYRAPEPLICKNIYHEGRYVGRLAVILPDKEVDLEFLKAIFDFSAPYIERLYDQYSSFSTSTVEYRKIHEYMQLIFEQQPADRRAFVALMQQMGIRESDDLVVAALFPVSENMAMFNCSFICRHLERVFPGCFCIVRKENIIILASLTYYQDKTGGTFPEDLGKELAASSYRTGISRVFHTLNIFEVMFDACGQSRYAVEQSLLKGSSTTLSYFDDYALSFLLQHGLTGTNFLQNGHPALIALKNHDEENGSEYLHTLKVYMDLNMNAVAAAKALYIHRSSFIGRMERINRLVDLHLDDPKERLYINLTFALFLETK